MASVIPQRMTTCPHCGREQSAGKHVTCCPQNPAVFAAVHAALEDADEPGAAVTKERYDRARKAPSASRTALMDFYGDWAAVCAAHGLKHYGRMGRKQIPRARRPAERSQCPHCGKAIALMAVDNHAARCPQNPAHYAVIRAAAENPAAPGVALLQDEYAVAARVLGVPGMRLITAHFGGWVAAMAYYGLRVMSGHEAVEYAAMQETAAAAAEARCILAEERNGGYGLAVLRVLPAPGLSVNGRECVRCELR